MLAFEYEALDNSDFNRLFFWGPLTSLAWSSWSAGQMALSLTPSRGRGWRRLLRLLFFPAAAAFSVVVLFGIVAINVPYSARIFNKIQSTMRLVLKFTPMDVSLDASSKRLDLVGALVNQDSEPIVIRSESVCAVVHAWREADVDEELPLWARLYRRIAPWRHGNIPDAKCPMSGTITSIQTLATVPKAVVIQPGEMIVFDASLSIEENPFTTVELDDDDRKFALDLWLQSPVPERRSRRVLAAGPLNESRDEWLKSLRDIAETMSTAVAPDEHERRAGDDARSADKDASSRERDDGQPVAERQRDR